MSAREPKPWTLWEITAWTVVAVGLVGVGVAGWLIFGPEEEKQPDARAEACEAYDAWHEKAYEQTLGMGADEKYERHLNEEQALEDEASDQFAEAAEQHESWIPVRESFRAYALAMIGYNPGLDNSAPGADAVRRDSSITIEAACDRL